MKKIKIFLASSEELKEERIVMEALFNRLNKLFKGRGLELDLEIWEYLDASMTDKRKQDEYNDVLKQCDICIVLFWRKFGCYTGEELDTAYQRMRQKEKPYKIYVFFKNPNSDEITPELKDFIANYEKRYGGHFFSKFEHVDTMKLEFLLQLENYQKELIGESAIEVRNEHVYVDNEEFVDLNNIPFASKNEGFLKKKSELARLRKEIEQKQQEYKDKEKDLELAKKSLEKDSENEIYKIFFENTQKEIAKATDSLQELLDKKNKLEEEFEREQQNLFNTARRITELRGVNISQRMTRAIEAFEAGDAQRADVILDEAEKDDEQVFEDIQVAKKVGLQKLDELILRTSIKMANNTIPIDDRVAETQKIYEKAVKLAKEAGYDDVKYAELIEKYGHFLYEYGKYEESIEYEKKILTLRRRIYGDESIEMAWALFNMARNYKKEDVNEILKYLREAERIVTQSKEKDEMCESAVYNNLGNVLKDMGEYNEAIEYHKKSLAIQEKLYGKKSPGVAYSLTNLGTIAHDQNDYDSSLKYHRQALEIKLITLGKNNQSTAISYSNLGAVLCDKGDFAESIRHHKIAVDIYEKYYGLKHPSTSDCYCSIGKVFYIMKDYSSSIKWNSKAAEQGNAMAQYNLGVLYWDVEQNYHKAKEWYSKAAEQGNAIAQYNLGMLYWDVEQNHHKAKEWMLKAAEQGNAMAQYNLGMLYWDVEQNYHKAKEWMLKAAEQGVAEAQGNLGWLYEEVEQNHHKAKEWMLKAAEQGVAEAQDNLGWLYEEVEQDYGKAVEWYLKAAEQEYENSYNNLAWIYYLMEEYETALIWAGKAILAIPEDSYVIDTLASIYQSMGRYEEALQQFEQCLELQKEQQLSEEDIQETEAKIAQLKKLTEQQNK